MRECGWEAVKLCTPLAKACLACGLPPSVRAGRTAHLDILGLVRSACASVSPMRDGT